MRSIPCALTNFISFSCEKTLEYSRKEEQSLDQPPWNSRTHMQLIEAAARILKQSTYVTSPQIDGWNIMVLKRIKAAVRL